MHPLTTNISATTRDVHRFSFESAGALEIDNSIGAPILDAYWQDPDFDPQLRAFYYVRVLEIPTPNWTVYDAKKLGSELPEGEPVSIRDRAYSSPIWYTPG